MIILFWLLKQKVEIQRDTYFAASASNIPLRERSNFKATEKAISKSPSCANNPIVSAGEIPGPVRKSGKELWEWLFKVKFFQKKHKKLSIIIQCINEKSRDIK